MWKQKGWQLVAHLKLLKETYWNTNGVNDEQVREKK